MRIRLLVALIIGAVLFFGATSATAQDSELTVLREMPTGTVITVQNVQYKAFTLDEYKQVALIYTDYVYWMRQTASLHQELQLRIDMEKNYALQIEGLKDITKTLELDRNYWNTRVKEEQEANKRRETLSNLERFGAWALVAIEALALGAMGIAGAAND